MPLVLFIPSIIISYLVLLKTKDMSVTGFVLAVFVFTIVNMNVLFWYRGINLIAKSKSEIGKRRGLYYLLLATMISGAIIVRLYR